jgi:subtilisin
MRSVNLRRAFTITELVVVVAIILMIIGLGTYALTAARKAGEDIAAEAQAALQNDHLAKAKTKKSLPPVIPGPQTLAPIPNQYIVVFQNWVTNPAAQAQQMAQAYPTMKILHTYQSGLKGFSATMSADILANVKADPRTAYVEQNNWMTVSAQTIPTGVRRIFSPQSSVAPGSQKVPAIGKNPLVAFPQPGPQDIAKGGGTKFGVNVVVAVIDTGIDATHPDLNVEFSKGFGFPDGVDGNGHGTHVSGIIGARDNGFGVVGVAPGARLWALKCLDASGAGTNADVIAAIDYVATHFTQVAVANMSLGGSFSQAVNDAVTACVNKGVVMVAAAGNSAADASGFSPASATGVICVGAYADSDGLPGGKGAAVSTGEKDDTFATSFSNFGKRVDVIAPGCDILSTVPVSQGSYGKKTGTSMAAPHVSGLAAVIRDPDAKKSGGILDLRSKLNSPGFSPAIVLQLMIQYSSRQVPGPANRTYPLIDAAPF